MLGEEAMQLFQTSQYQYLKCLLVILIFGVTALFNFPCGCLTLSLAFLALFEGHRLMFV